MIKENEICFIEVRHVYLRAQEKSLETHRGKAAHADLRWVSLFTAFRLFRAVLFSKIVALPEWGEVPVKCGKWVFKTCYPITAKLYYTDTSNYVNMVRVSLSSWG